MAIIINNKWNEYSKHAIDIQSSSILIEITKINKLIVHWKQYGQSENVHKITTLKQIKMCLGFMIYKSLHINLMI